MLRSLATRTSRAVFGVLSVWCLGCTSLDIVLDELLHGGAPAIECVMVGDADAKAPTDGAPNVRASGNRSLLDACGCDHCVAVRANVASSAMPRLTAPEAVAHKPVIAPNVVREPLVPPPIGRIAA